MMVVIRVVVEVGGDFLEWKGDYFWIAVMVVLQLLLLCTLYHHHRRDCCCLMQNDDDGAEVK